MAHYLLIGSRDPFESNDVGQLYDLATGLKKDGNEVTLFLVQNGVLGARPSTRSGELSKLASAGVKVLADEFSLKERGIGKLAAGISTAPIDAVIDHLASGAKALWH